MHSHQTTFHNNQTTPSSAHLPYNQGVSGGFVVFILEGFSEVARDVRGHLENIEPLMPFLGAQVPLVQKQCQFSRHLGHRCNIKEYWVTPSYSRYVSHLSFQHKKI